MKLNFTPEEIHKARQRGSLAEMVDTQTFFKALDDIERLTATETVIDSNGEYCPSCDGCDQDGEGVYHTKTCPQGFRGRVRSALLALRIDRHRESEDGWYSCPKADNYSREDGSTECCCGKDYNNQIIDGILNDFYLQK